MYDNFALYYDKLIKKDVDYVRLADYVEDIFKKFSKKPHLVLDLACGTGSFSLEFAKRGYDMTAVDISPDMLSIAKEKCSKHDILFLCQDMREFELYGTVDAILVLTGGINFLLI